MLLFTLHRTITVQLAVMCVVCRALGASNAGQCWGFPAGDTYASPDC